MSFSDQRFVVDTNILGQLGRSRRSSQFFRETAVLPELVAHEARGLRDIQSLMDNVQPTTTRTLEFLMEVMKSIPKTDSRLVDLYSNLGSADPLVIACALEGREYDEATLLPNDWAIVSGDEAVRAKSREFGLRVLGKQEFIELIDKHAKQI